MFFKFKRSNFQCIRTALTSIIRTFKKQSLIENRSFVPLISSFLPTFEHESILNDYVCSYLTRGYDDQRPSTYTFGTSFATKWSVFLAFVLVWQEFVEYSQKTKHIIYCVESYMCVEWLFCKLLSDLPAANTGKLNSIGNL